jgi:predicted TPR repeat methyltransferase
MKKPDLSGAYALDGPEACLRLYADWAETYDADFAADMDYRLPAEVAAAFLRASPPQGPVLDVGAGTGLLAMALRGLGHDAEIDGIDISTEMLEIASKKGIYRDLSIADITRPIDTRRRYAGIVSSGTFTHGHVGAEGVMTLLDLAQPGAVVAFSVNAAVWVDKGFEALLETLAPRIRETTITEVAIYGDAARARDPEHAADVARILSFRLP